jgi:hypothetical protein
MVCRRAPRPSTHALANNDPGRFVGRRRRIQRLSVDANGGDGAEDGANVFVDLRDVASSSARLDIDKVEPPVQQPV